MKKHSYILTRPAKMIWWTIINDVHWIFLSQFIANDPFNKTNLKLNKVSKQSKSAPPIFHKQFESGFSQLFCIGALPWLLPWDGRFRLISILLPSLLPSFSSDDDVVSQSVVQSGRAGEERDGETSRPSSWNGSRGLEFGISSARRKEGIFISRSRTAFCERWGNYASSTN